MKALIVGGRGFIGTHLANRLIDDGYDVSIYDITDGKDARELIALVLAMRGHDTVFHLASNADIAKAATCPGIDFDNGTVITSNVVEATRLCGVLRLVYASGSGIYGDCGTIELSESHGPLMPSSPYGASKLAGEGLVSAYSHMFGMTGVSLRFANVVGPGQTHGVGYDFINRLRDNPERLEVMGNGMQSKHYVIIDDVVDALMLAATRHFEQPYEVFNVATPDWISVRQIATMACEVMGATDCEIVYEDQDGGWAGDVPIVRMQTNRIRMLGWKSTLSSRDAMMAALKAMA